MKVHLCNRCKLLGGSKWQRNFMKHKSLSAKWIFVCWLNVKTFCIQIINQLDFAFEIALKRVWSDISEVHASQMTLFKLNFKSNKSSIHLNLNLHLQKSMSSILQSIKNQHVIISYNEIRNMFQLKHLFQWFKLFAF